MQFSNKPHSFPDTPEMLAQLVVIESLVELDLQLCCVLDASPVPQF